jgi:hypothetical protein
MYVRETMNWNGCGRKLLHDVLKYANYPRNCVEGVRKFVDHSSHENHQTTCGVRAEQPSDIVPLNFFPSWLILRFCQYLVYSATW